METMAYLLNIAPRHILEIAKFHERKVENMMIKVAILWVFEKIEKPNFLYGPYTEKVN